MRDVLREEKKFLLNQAEALKLRNYLSKVIRIEFSGAINANLSYSTTVLGRYAHISIIE